MGRPQITAALLTLATVMFVWGALAERSTSHTEGAIGHTNQPANDTVRVIHAADERGVDGSDAHSTPSTEPREPDGSDVHGAGGSESSTPGVHHDESAENRKILGIDLESGSVISLGTLISLTLALLILQRRDRVVVVTLIAVAVGFVVLEIAEVQHQNAEGRPGLVALATIAGLLHLAAGVSAATLFSDAVPTPAPD